MGVISDGAHMGGGLNGQDAYTGRIIAYRKSKRAQSVTDEESLVEAADRGQAVAIQAGATRENLESGPGGSGGGNPPAIAFDARQKGVIEYGPISGPLDTDGTSIGIMQGVACINLQGSKSNACVATDGSAYSLNAMHGHDVHAVYAASATVRRLTPRECERLQGFPDDWTLVPWRGKPASDGPRYRAIGNSMAVNCMEWIGQRIAAAEARR